MPAWVRYRADVVRLERKHVNVQLMREALERLKLEVVLCVRLPDDTGTQFRLANGARVNVSDTGRCRVRGGQCETVVAALVQALEVVDPSSASLRLAGESDCRPTGAGVYWEQLRLFQGPEEVSIARPEAPQCLVCRAPKRLEEHHLDGHHENRAPSNVVVLCSRCHTVLHQDGWVATTLELLEMREKVDRRREERRQLSPPALGAA